MESSVSSPRSDVSLSAEVDPCGWMRLYRRYAASFVEDGRVVDITTGARSTSEGQAYGLFFALVAGDQTRFDAMATWTRDNLLAGRWKGLPAWLWGAREDGSWGVLDPNSATDADLWMAYAFVEAGRIWARPELVERGRSLAARILSANLRSTDEIGPVLLPAPYGFEHEDGRRLRLNPSYLVLAQFRRFAALEVPGPWDELEATARLILTDGSRGGFAPDWLEFVRGQGFESGGQTSSYDAIRAPLFAAFEASNPLLESVSGPLRSYERSGRLHERFLLGDEVMGEGRAPPGFAAALMPAAARLAPDALASLRDWLEGQQHGGLYGHPVTYYDQNLILFGRGHLEGHYRFGPRGELIIASPPRECTAS